MNELTHYGILGMKWGIRKERSGISNNTTRMANKDAKRFADAKMFYGKTAGTKRKLLNAEINKKKRTIDGYEDAFNEALNNVDYAKSAKKAVLTRNTKDAAYRARVTTKQILGITGPLTIAAAGAIYNKNKSQIDAFVAKSLKKVVSHIRR